VGTLSCKTCGQRFQSDINCTSSLPRFQASLIEKWGNIANIVLDLSGPVDVYSDWVDACEEVAHRKGDKELAEGNKAGADGMEFSTYGTGEEPRREAVGDGDENDDDY
jgi:transcription elongation factor Elf1